MTLIIALKLIGGLVALVIGGDLLIRGASKIAASLGVSPLVIGLTIVAFGTSAPELVVSLQSSFAGHDNIAMANVIGSNIFNVLLVLGACAIFKPLIISSQLVRIDVPLMVASAILLYFLSLNGNVSTIEGSILFSILVFYTVFLVKKSRKESKEVKEEFDQGLSEEKLSFRDLSLNILFVVAGLGFLVLGGDWFVSSAVVIAKLLGVSDTVIGLTIIAGGTSLPEVATSLIATIKGQRDIAIGNVVGSNIFNVLLIVGLSAVASPKGLFVSDDLLALDFPVMLATSIACLPIFLAGFIVTRLDGLVFLLCYLTYLGFIVLKATKHDFLPGFQDGLFYFGLPVLFLALLGSSYQAFMTLRRKN